MYFKLEQKDLPCYSNVETHLSPLPHFHKHLEFVLLRKGKTLAIADSKQDYLEVGDLYVSFPNQIHYYHDITTPHEHFILILSPDICPEFKNEFKNFLPVSPILKGAADNPRLLSAFTNIMALNTTKPKYYETEIKGNMLILLSELFQNMPLENKKTCDIDLLTNIIHYCYENYTEDISLQSLADALHVSHFYISHIFNERLHISFRDYINSLRIEKACELLKASEQNITEIAYEAGFNSTRTFDRCFLKFKEISPKKYREQLLAERKDIQSAKEFHFS